jgi:hypothetical protein
MLLPRPGLLYATRHQHPGSIIAAQLVANAHQRQT